MQRVMPGGMSSYLGCLQQHRKCQYAGNMISAGNEESFPKKRCDYTQYNLLPSNKSEGELTYSNGSEKRQRQVMSWLKQYVAPAAVFCVRLWTFVSIHPFSVIVQV